MEPAWRYRNRRNKFLYILQLEAVSVFEFVALNERGKAENFSKRQVVRSYIVLSEFPLDPSFVALFSAIFRETFARCDCQSPTIRSEPTAVLDGMFTQRDERGPRLLNGKDSRPFR